MAKGKKTGGTEAYCMKCKGKVEVDSPQEVTMKNGRKATKGVCSKCGTTVYKIGGGCC